MSDYTKYLHRQLGIKESTGLKPVDINPETIDPKELESGIKVEREHTRDDAVAKKIALHHLAEDPKYYSHMAKSGLKETSPLQNMLSPTARATPVIAVAIRGSNTGGLPSGADQTGISPSTPTGRLGGYEPIPAAKDNSQVIDKTPQNSTINSSTPIAPNGGDVQSDPHPHQVQHAQGEPPQNVTGASTDSDTALTLKSAMSKGIDVDVAQECDTCGCGDPTDQHDKDNDMDGEETEEDNEIAKQGLNEGKHKAGCTCGFCANKGKFGKKKKEDGDDKEEKKDDDDGDDTSLVGLMKGKSSKNKAKKEDEKEDKAEDKEDKKFDFKKLNEVKRTLQEKAMTGKMNKKETQVYQLIQEVLKKRGFGLEEKMFRKQTLTEVAGVTFK